MPKRINQRWLRKQTASNTGGQEALLYDTLYNSRETTKFVLSLLEKKELSEDPRMLSSLRNLCIDQEHFMGVLKYQLDEMYPDTNIWGADEIEVGVKPPPIKLQ